MRKLSTALQLSAGLLALALCLSLPPEAQAGGGHETRDTAEDAAADAAAAGRDIFLEARCNLCHAVSGADIEAKTRSEALLGPDLAGIGERMKPGDLTTYLRKEEPRDGRLHKKAFSGTDRELAALIDWLVEQPAAK